MNTLAVAFSLIFVPKNVNCVKFAAMARWIVVICVSNPVQRAALH
jgi:hypothetical protein